MQAPTSPPTPPPPRPSLRALLEAVSERHRPATEPPAARWLEKVAGRLLLESIRYAIFLLRAGELVWMLIVRFRWLVAAAGAGLAWAARHFHWLGH